MLGLTFSRRMGRTRVFLAALLLTFAGSLFAATTADARIGGGGSFGSRGTRTYNMPMGTPTAPRVAPFQRSAAPNGGFAPQNFGRSSPGFMGGGFGRGLLGGFLGAGIFGLMFGHGLTGGLGGGLSFIGLILQLGLLFLGVRFVMGMFANRPQPYGGMGMGSFGGGLPGGSAPQPQAQGGPINIGPEDYQAFEQRLAQSQMAYSNGDIAALQRIATPEMAGNFAQELRSNDSQGVVNKLADVRLLNGDLSEAWHENGSDYATVAMRFSLIDATLEKATGRVVAGDAQRAQEVTEVWTFRRPSGGGAQSWALSAIQQA